MGIFKCIIAIVALYIIGLSEVKGLSEDNFIRTSVGVIDLNLRMTKDTDEAVNIKTSGKQHSRVRRSTGFSETESQAILDKHNALRSQVSPEASDMQFMTWDDDLATMAQQWSDMCNFNHGQPTNISPYSSIGQNLYLRSGGPDNRANGEAATQAWYNEYQSYTHETNHCQENRVCGHYKQIVWADSHAVGCGLSYCSSTTDGASNVWIITCNYGPAGNIGSQHPYTSGRSCTECPPDSRQCYNNQCRSCSDHNEACICNLQCKNCGTLDSENCTCTCQQGYVGNECSGICQDISDLCNAGWYYPQCFTHGYVLNGCPKLCGTCTDPDPNFVCVETTTMTTTTVPQTTARERETTETTTITTTTVPQTTARERETTESLTSTAVRPTTSVGERQTTETTTMTTTTVPQTTDREIETTESLTSTAVRPTTSDGERQTTETECRLDCWYGVCRLDEDGNAFCECSTGFSGPTCKREIVYCPCGQNP